MTMLTKCLRYAFSLMGKLAQLLGKEATVRLFLDKFTDSCQDEEWEAVREACAKNFGEICAVLGQEISEYRMVPLFCRLCQDVSWSVRKACAEVFMLVSCAVPLAARRHNLSECFLRLLKDEEYWVRAMSHQVLGAFISTFADPPVTGLAYDPYGELIFVGPEGYEFRVVSHQHMPPRNMSIGLRRMNANQVISTEPIGCSSDAESSSNVFEEDEDSDEFNTFNFWKIPIGDLDPLIEDDSIQANLTSLDFELATLSEKLDKCTSKDGNESVISVASTPDSGWNSGSSTPKPSNIPLILRLPGFIAPKRTDWPSPIKNKPPQSVVPPALLDSFIQMALPRGESEKELSMHCAYFLPAVASTLGPVNWPWLTDTFKALAVDRQWKVRRTIACCLHDLAVLLGEEQSINDLAPALKALLKDLDEVRIGALRNLAATLKLFPPQVRDSFLPILQNILTPTPTHSLEGDHNWRFREEVALQLYMACPLFTPPDCLEYLCAPALTLLGDKVAAVRSQAITLISRLVNYASASSSPNASLLLRLLTDKWAVNDSWTRRCVFAQLCSTLAVADDENSKPFDCDLFATSLLPNLLRLARDPVPNVRLCVARCISRDLVNSGYLTEGTILYNEVLSVLESLRQDSDRDVVEAAYTDHASIMDLSGTVNVSGESLGNSSS